MDWKLVCGAVATGLVALVLALLWRLGQDLPLVYDALIRCAGYALIALCAALLWLVIYRNFVDAHPTSAQLERQEWIDAYREYVEGHGADRSKS